MPSNFNPELFMDAVIEGANDTKVIPVPAQEWHAQIDDVKLQVNEIKKGDRAGEYMAKANIWWEITDPAALEATARTKVRVRQEIVLDLMEDGSSLDMGKGKNVRLGKLREAIGLNDPRVPFSFRQLPGHNAVIVVGHRTDPDDSSIIYDEVKAVRAQS